jgi:hypothetical protein
MWDVLFPKKEIIDSCENDKCKIKRSEINTYIRKPHPKMLNLNFNWDLKEASCGDLLKVYLSFADNLSLKDFYQVPSKESDRLSGYDLESFTAFIGAHYMIFVSIRDSDGSKTTMWKLFNDTETQFFMDWNEVVAFCLSSKCIPTLLFYEVTEPVLKGSKAQQKDINRFYITRD